MRHFIICIILVQLVSLSLHVEGVSLFPYISTEAQENEKQGEGLSKQQALPESLRGQDDAIPPAGGEEDAKVPEIDPASNTPQVMSFNQSSAEINDSEHVESPPKPEQLKQIALSDNLRQQDDAIPLDGGKEDATLPEMDPASNTLQVMSSIQSSAEKDNDSEHVDSLPKPEQLKPIEQPVTLDQSDGSPQGTDHRKRVKRSPKFVPLPNCEDCLLSGSSDDNFYEVTDPATGLECRCDLCPPGRIVLTDCTCDPFTYLPADWPRQTECIWVDQGRQYMPVKNKCKTGIECSVCRYPRIVKIACSATVDVECKCGKDGYGIDCKPKPRCDKDYEPRFGDGGQYDVMTCQPCEDGYHQPNSNSTDRCRKQPDPPEPITPSPADSTFQDSGTSPETFNFTPYVSTMESTTNQAVNSTQIICDNRTDVTPSSEEPTSTDVIHHWTWKDGLIITVCSLIGMFVGGFAVYKYITKDYILISKELPPSKKSQAGGEFVALMNRRQGQEQPIN